DHRDRDPDHRAQDRVGRGVHPEMEPGQREDRDQPGRKPPAALPPERRPPRTIVEATPSGVAAKTPTGPDGIAHPPQLPRSSTPNGRGRSTVASRTTSSTARKEPTNTSRWRKRRSTSNAIRVAHRSTLIMPADPVEATIASMRPVTPGTRSPAS